MAIMISLGKVFLCFDYIWGYGFGRGGCEGWVAGGVRVEEGWREGVI